MAAVAPTLRAPFLATPRGARALSRGSARAPARSRHRGHVAVAADATASGSSALDTLMGAKIIAPDGGGDDAVRSGVQTYYGETLQTSDDLKTSACCTPYDLPKRIRGILSNVPDEVKAKYYGCGSPTPQGIDGLRQRLAALVDLVGEPEASGGRGVDELAAEHHESSTTALDRGLQGRDADRGRDPESMDRVAESGVGPGMHDVARRDDRASSRDRRAVHLGDHYRVESAESTAERTETLQERRKQSVVGHRVEIEAGAERRALAAQAQDVAAVALGRGGSGFDRVHGGLEGVEHRCGERVAAIGVAEGERRDAFGEIELAEGGHARDGTRLRSVIAPARPRVGWMVDPGTRRGTRPARSPGRVGLRSPGSTPRCR